MTTQLYLQKAEMQLSRGLEEKGLESLLAAIACQDGDTVSDAQARCFLGEYWFVHQQYAPRHRSNSAGFLTEPSSWKRTTMTFLMRKSVKPRHCWELCRGFASTLNNDKGGKDHADKGMA